MARTTLLLIALALAFASLELSAALLGPYGLFHDELYYWVGAQRLELGYVDHPPLAPWLLAVITAVFGDGRFSFALLPALCGAATALLTGLTARSFGANRFGQLLAALCITAAPVILVFCSFYSVNAIEVLLSTASTYLVVELIRTGRQRYWLAIGMVTGIALLNKHTFALLGFGLAAGILATPMRSHLRSRWLWLGCLLALLLALPNLYWNLENGWPSLVFYRSRDDVGNIPTSITQALLLQLASMGPVAPLVWIPGLLFLLSPRGQRYRALGIAFLVLFAVMILSGQRRPDRIVGAYPVVLAAGAAYWDRRRGRWGRRLRWIVVGLVLLSGAATLPGTLPLLSPERVAGYFRAIGTMPDIEKADVGQSIPGYFLGRLEWERFADQVIEAWERLPDEDRSRSVILVPHWVFGSVIEYYGRDRGLPPVVAPHNAYFFWRQRAAGRDVVVSVAVDAAALVPHFADTSLLTSIPCQHCPGFARDLPVLLSRSPDRPLDELLVEWRHFGLDPAPQLLRLD